MTKKAPSRLFCCVGIRPVHFQGKKGRQPDQSFDEVSQGIILVHRGQDGPGFASMSFAIRRLRGCSSGNAALSAKNSNFFVFVSTVAA